MRFMEPRSLLSLPNETLLHIFQYLEQGDILSVSKSCSRFNEVFCEKRLVRNVNFESTYSLDTRELKVFFRPKQRCDNVVSLSLTSCYWLPAQDIVNCVLKLKELKNLFVSDTKFTINHLNKISPVLPRLRRLAITGDTKSLTGRSTVASHLSSLVGLRVCLRVVTSGENTDPSKCLLLHLTRWLAHFSSLEELQVEGRCNCIGRSWSSSGSPALPHLHSFTFNVQCQQAMVDKFCAKILRQFDPTTKWRRLTYGRILEKTGWAYNPPNHTWRLKGDVHGCSHLRWIAGKMPEGSYPHLSHLIFDAYNVKFTTEECTMPELKHLTIKNVSIDWCLGSWNELLSRLDSLFLRAEPEFFSTCRHNFSDMEKMTNLRSLSLVFRSVQPLREDGSSSIIEGMTYLVNAFPNITEFRLELESDNWYLPAASCKGDVSNNWKDFLLLIPKWTHLCKLLLINIQIKNGNFLTELGNSCPGLETLQLVDRHTPVSCRFYNQLNHALPKWKNLKHFRLEYVDFGKPESLLESLLSCPLLETLVIIRHGSFGHPFGPQYSQALGNLVTKAVRLVLLVVSVGSSTDVWHKNASRRLAARGPISRRHALVTKIAKGFNWWNEDLPWVHFNTMCLS